MPKVQFDVDAVAKLAMLDLTDEDHAALEKDLPSIVAYVSKLHEVDTSEIEAAPYLTDQVNAFRSDEVEPMPEEERRAMIDSFPKKTGDALEVPAVFE